MKTLLTFYYALKDPRTPWYAKLTAALSIIYLVSPADLLPDIIPLAGYIDDIVVVPFLLHFANKLLPQEVRSIAEQKAIKNRKKLLWIKIGIAILVIGIMVLTYFLAKSLYEHIR
jgi:uncharacterized membrane protein YkvA (DUF1232 family)